MIIFSDKTSQIRMELLQKISAKHYARQGVKNVQIFTPNTGKYGPEKTLYLDTFNATIP